MEIDYPNGTTLIVYESNGSYYAKVEDKDGFTRKILGAHNVPYTKDALEALKILVSHFDAVHISYNYFGDERNEII